MSSHAVSDNLARTAHASASETYEDLTPEKAIDGVSVSRWSGIPGHNAGVWYQLDWDASVTISQVIIHQHDRYCMEWDVQVWDDGAWRTVRHLGEPGMRLPLVVICEFDPITTSRLRIGNITNGPSFTEVEVYEKPIAVRPWVEIASDANGNIIGMATDLWGSAPVEGAEIVLRGQSAAGTWNADARSDGKGLFFVSMPLGLNGDVSIVATHDGKTMERTMSAGDLQYGLTPLSHDTEVVSLNGTWRFAADPPDGFWQRGYDDSEWSDIRVPAHWEMEGFRSLDGVGGYRRIFSAPPGAGRLKLRFDGVYSGAEAWVNGERVAYHEGGALPFEADVTDIVKPGDNLLALRVVEHTRVSDRLDKMSMYADFPLAGIFRKVTLFRVPDAHIGALRLATDFDDNHQDAALSGVVSIVNEASSMLTGAQLVITLTDATGAPIPCSAQPRDVDIGAWQRADVPISVQVPTPAKWEAEHPNLYLLSMELRTEGKLIQRLTQRVGFRQTEIRGSEILINGTPVKLRGTCHHDSHPLLGRAVTPELERQDLELMKEANLNALRTSHYLPLPELLEFADEMGFYVEDEGSFCWAEATDDLRLTPRIMQMNAELLARDRNHPCVTLWSICNESRMGYGLVRAGEWMRESDPSRPLTASYHRDGELDVAIRHNPITVTRIEEIDESLRIPLLWDESLCIYQGIWGDYAELWLDPGMRDYYVVPLRGVYDRFMKSSVVQGSMIWCWSDDLFCLPGAGIEYGRTHTAARYAAEAYSMRGGGVVGDAPWGVVDGWRRKKPEFWHTKKLHSPVKVPEEPIAPGATIRVPVENQYDFTNLSELRIDWQIGTRAGTLTADVSPRSEGELAVNASASAGDVLSLTFTDHMGRMVDTYRLPVGETRRAAPPPALPAGPLNIREAQHLSGGATLVVGEGFELGFGHYFGTLRRGVAGDDAVLLSLPALHVLPASEPLSPLPAALTWRLADLEIRPEGENVRVTLRGAYERFEGGYDLLVTPVGEIIAHAKFTYSGEELKAREIGLRLSVPRECDRLEWDRRGEHSVYPEDHIGRSRGETPAFAEHGATAPPDWPWAQDNSPMGCNDFRSTKRNVHWVSLRRPDGSGVCVLSDGTRSARAMVAPDGVWLHVGDWFGGTGAGLGEWVENYGDGKLLRPGDVIESTVRLRLLGRR